MTTPERTHCAPHCKNQGRRAKAESPTTKKGADPSITEREEGANEGPLEEVPPRRAKIGKPKAHGRRRVSRK